MFTLRNSALKSYVCSRNSIFAFVCLNLESKEHKPEISTVLRKLGRIHFVCTFVKKIWSDSFGYNVLTMISINKPSMMHFIS